MRSYQPSTSLLRHLTEYARHEQRATAAAADHPSSTSLPTAFTSSTWSPPLSPPNSSTPSISPLSAGASSASDNESEDEEACDDVSQLSDRVAMSHHSFDAGSLSYSPVSSPASHQPASSHGLAHTHQPSDRTRTHSHYRPHGYPAHTFPSAPSSHCQSPPANDCRRRYGCCCRCSAIHRLSLLLTIHLASSSSLICHHPLCIAHRIDSSCSPPALPALLAINRSLLCPLLCSSPPTIP